MATTSLTLRLDEELKQRLERMAEAEDRSASEYVVRAIKERIEIQCPACGRSSGSAVLPVGLSPAFLSWMSETKRTMNRYPVCLTTNEAGRRTAYWVRYFPRSSPDEGMLCSEILLNHLDMISNPRVLIPLGDITGWASDNDGSEFQQLCAIGYINGNMTVARFAMRNQPR